MRASGPQTFNPVTQIGLVSPVRHNTAHCLLNSLPENTVQLIIPYNRLCDLSNTEPMPSTSAKALLFTEKESTHTCSDCAGSEARSPLAANSTKAEVSCRARQYPHANCTQHSGKQQSYVSAVQTTFFL
eukprot:scaffold209919_cov18-Prasinocladus_malaysianus.AAC.1